MTGSISEKEPLLDSSRDNSAIIDTIIIGAGISGVNAAYRIQSQFPSSTYTILESRYGLGGTWDFFRFPGIRSDSDLHTFGFPWRPWTEQAVIADGASIKKYIDETAAAYGIDKHVQFGEKVVAADWSSDTQCWTLNVDVCAQEEEKSRRKTYHARFVILATGYYDYDEPLRATIPGIENFGGTVVHPQFWPSDLDYTDKNIVVIGSGATAVTLLPSLAKTAKHVTMLQRSPSYIMIMPQPQNRDASWLYRLLPTWFYLKLQRFQYLLVAELLFRFCRAFPNAARRFLNSATTKNLPKSIPHDPHFNPRYVDICQHTPYRAVSNPRALNPR